MRRARLLAVAAPFLAVVLAAPSLAASAGPLTVGPGNTRATWQGRHFDQGTVQKPESCAPGGAHESRCDHVTMTADTDAAYWRSHTGGLQVAITWASARDDFDLYLYDGTGKLVGIAASTGTTGEQLFLSRAAGTYEARVVPVAVEDGAYEGSAIFTTQDTTGDDGAEQDPAVTYFTYGPDEANWYWKDQSETEAPLPKGQSIAVRLPSPQAPDTLPVAIRKGKQYKNPALRFDLGLRGLVEGSQITEFTLSIQEGTAKEAAKAREEPPLSPDDGVIEACRIVELWGPGEAELWNLRPAVDGSSCIRGVRTAEAGATVWRFDLTELAQPWAADPASSLGILLMGGVDPGASGPAETWQVNLKLPSRDDPATTENEYEQTQKRVAIDLVVQAPGESAGDGGSDGVVPPPTTDSYYPPTSSSYDPYGSSSFYGPGTGSTFTTTSDGFVSTAPTRPEAAVPASSAARTPAVATLPHIPWYAWALMPFALVALVAAHSAIVEYAGGTRPDGVISAIRRRNQAVRRGATVTHRPPAARWRRTLMAMRSRTGTAFVKAREQVLRKKSRAA